VETTSRPLLRPDETEAGCAIAKPEIGDLGLALSGGGVRAAIFHLGVLRRLAADSMLERVTRLSTVSGGSLVIATLFSRSEMRWPLSAEFAQRVYPELRKLLTTTDLLTFRSVGVGGLLRFNIRLLTHRASVVADLLEERWGVQGRLPDLPETPTWWINTTSLHTGKNWRFARDEMGDWQFGAHYTPNYRIADAAAASAAVPYVIGALKLPLPAAGWFERDRATRETRDRKKPEVRSIRLWDGGAYENMGLEALYKPNHGLLGCDFLLSSDASGELVRGARMSPFGLLRGKLASPRLFDVTSDQIRALRSRMFVGDLEGSGIRGALVRMGNSVRELHIKGPKPEGPVSYDRFLSDEDVRLALLHPTDLAAVSESLFDRIARHGFEATDATLCARYPDHFPLSIGWKA
jgi:NTE family protein